MTLKCRLLCVLGGGVLLLTAAANGQFVNGGFETGSLSGWTVTPTPNGTTGVQLVELFDIDGPGPLGDSLAAKFSVGNLVTPNQPFEGITLAQSLALTGGVQYTISFNWAAIRTIATNNAEGGRFALVVNGVELAVQSAGSTNNTTPHYGFISANYTPASTGSYSVGVKITRQFTVPGIGGGENLFQYVDNFKLEGGPAPCYADCNGDGVLGLADFGCFQTKFALGDPYADCNGDGVLGLADFGCFQTKFALGCP
jgi:hypothetical protein